MRWGTTVDVLMVDLNPSRLKEAADSLNLPGPIDIPERHGDVDSQMAHICQALWAESLAGYPLGRLFGESLANALASCLVQRYNASPSPAPAPAAGTLSPRSWRILRSYIEEHLHSDISLDDMARIARLSPYHFSRCFKAMTGTSPHQYLIERRVEHARKLLLNSDHSLANIALQSGFSDQSHLTRHMKRLLGVTPSLLAPHRNRRKNIQ